MDRRDTKTEHAIVRSWSRLNRIGAVVVDLRREGDVFRVTVASLDARKVKRWGWSIDQALNAAALALAS